MKDMQRVAAIAAALIGLAGCGNQQGSTTPAGGAASDDPVVEMTRLKDALCACSDQDCAEQVGAKLNAMNQRFAGAKISDAEAEQVRTVSTEIDRCAAKLTGGPEDQRVSPSDN